VRRSPTTSSSSRADHWSGAAADAAGAAEQVIRPHLSVVIPAFNEESRLGPSLTRIERYLRQQRIDAEILVVDDGSTDSTAGVAAQQLKGHRGRVLRSPENCGKGHAARRGFHEATGRWILMTDADLSSPIEEYAKLAAAAPDRDLDIALGSRALSESRIEKRQNPLRQSMGKTFNLFVRLLTGLPFRDTQCGFKLLDRSRTEPLFEKMRVDGFAFDVELIFLAQRFGLSVAEVPVIWRNDERSSVGLVTDPARMLFDLMLIRWRFRRGVYNPETARPGTGAASGDS
jgi:glycosyltransferase involved in cell wall biosynthesis